MRIAVIDLLFNHPPKGGAGIDLFETFRRLSKNFDLCVFHPVWNTPHPRGDLTDIPPFPIQSILINPTSRATVIDTILNAVQAWKPDLVFIADGWTLKPYLTVAFSELYPTILRIYAYEMLCPRNNEYWLIDHACGNTALTDTQRCLACANDYRTIIKEKKGPDGNPLTHEMELAAIWDGSYAATLRKALTSARKVIVYNQPLADHLQDKLGITPSVLPGGADPDEFTTQRLPAADNRFRVLVFGRMDDPAKGATHALEAGASLVRKGVPILMTMTRRPQLALPWLKETGWQDRRQIKQLLAETDVVVVPSVWDEAFGMTWVEALAAGVPVITSATPGPLSYLRHEETALLYPAGNTTALATCLHRMISDPGLRQRLAAAGQRLVHEHLTWEHAAARMAVLLRE